MDPADLPSFAGALYCTDDAGCGLFPVTVSTNFSGVYGTGNALAAAMSDESIGSSASRSTGTSSRRRLRPLQEEAGDDGSASNVAGASYDNGGDGDGRVVRVRKNGAGDVLTSEQDMIDMFLRRRYDTPDDRQYFEVQIWKQKRTFYCVFRHSLLFYGSASNPRAWW